MAYSRFAYGLIFAEKIANIQLSSGSMTLLKLFWRGHWLRQTDFSGVIDNAKVHMNPLKFQIAVLGIQLF
jgi:hypothetical protein